MNVTEFFNTIWCYCANGVKSLDADKFQKPTNHNVKPFGGLWFSAYTPNEEYVNAWQEFCFNEYFNVMNVASDAMLLRIKPNARVYIINSAQDFFSLREAFPLVAEEGLDFRGNWLDWEAIAEQYDVVYVSDEGIRYNRVNMEPWDFESGIILNFDVVEPFEHLSLNPAKWLDAERADVVSKPNELREYRYSYEANGEVISGDDYSHSAKELFYVLANNYKKTCSAQLSSFEVYVNLLKTVRIDYVRDGGEVFPCELDLATLF